jgi:hypothetical protein
LKEEASISAWLKGFRLDLRFLAVGRICLGTIVFLDFLQALQWRNYYYNDYGVLPRAQFADLTSLQTTWSPYFLIGLPGFSTLLLVLSAVCALLFAAGWKTKWTTPLLWLAVLSLQERNPWVLIGGDAWLRATLFWLIFLPCGEHFSLDRVKDGPCRRLDTVSNAASVGLVMQVVYIYVWAGVAKYGESYQDGTTIYYVLTGMEFGEERARWLLYFPDYLKLASQSIPYWELAAGLLLIMPFWSRNLRKIGVATLILLHVGIWYCMDLYHFSAVAVATLLMLWLPGRRSERVAGPYLPKSVSVALILWCFLVLAYNPIRIYFSEQVSFKSRARANLLGLEQLWRLFAPVAPTSSFLVYPEVTLKDGSIQPLGFWGAKRAVPPDFEDREFHVRLSRYWRSLIQTNNQRTSTRRLNSYARWYARRWEQLYPQEKDKLKSVQLYYKVYPVLPNYEDSPPNSPLRIADFQVP